MNRHHHYVIPSCPVLVVEGRWRMRLTPPSTHSIQARMKWWRERAHSSFGHKKTSNQDAVGETIHRGGNVKGGEGATAHQEKHPFKIREETPLQTPGFPANMFVAATAAEATQTHIPTGCGPRVLPSSDCRLTSTNSRWNPKRKKKESDSDLAVGEGGVTRWKHIPWR